MSGGNQWNQITHKANWLYASVLFPVWLCIRLSSYLSVRWRARGTYKERCCPSGGVGPTLKVCEEKGLWWNGPGRTVTSPLRAEGHAGLAWFACEWARSIILVRELSHQIEKVKTSFYQPFPSETEQAINNWVQALGKVKQNDMGLVKRRGGIFVKLLMEKEAITGVILAPDGVEYDRKHPQKEGTKKFWRIK